MGEKDRYYIEHTKHHLKGSSMKTSECVSHKEEGHSNISCISLNMRAFVIPPSPQGELCQGRSIREGA